MITAEDIMFWLAGYVTAPGTLTGVVRDTATALRDFARLKWIDLLRVNGCGTKTRAELLAWAGEHGAHLIHRLPKQERDALASKEPAQ